MFFAPFSLWKHIKINQKIGSNHLFWSSLKMSNTSWCAPSKNHHVFTRFSKKSPGFHQVYFFIGLEKFTRCSPGFQKNHRVFTRFWKKKHQVFTKFWNLVNKYTWWKLGDFFWKPGENLVIFFKTWWKPGDFFQNLLKAW